MQERQRSWSVVWAWTSSRVQVEFPCAVCRTGVGSNSIFWNDCKHWVYKKCSGLKPLTKDPDYWCTWRLGTACLGWQTTEEVPVRPDKMEVIASLCYLGDMLSAASGCELSTTTCVKTAWKKFKELLPGLSTQHLSFKTHGYVYSSCVEPNFHASETWLLTKPNLQCLQWNDRAIRSDRLTMSSHKILSTRCNKLLAGLDFILDSGSGLYSEGEKAPLVYTRGML